MGRFLIVRVQQDAKWISTGINLDQVESIQPVTEGAASDPGAAITFVSGRRLVAWETVDDLDSAIGSATGMRPTWASEESLVTP